MGRVSTCQKNCNTIDLRRAQVNDGLEKQINHINLTFYVYNPSVVHSRYFF